jgi:hypothetical protein
MEPRKVCRPVVADSHHSGGEQDSDPDPHQVKRGIRIRIRIRVIGDWIRNTAA